jgi:hypothetical protein
VSFGIAIIVISMIDYKRKVKRRSARRGAAAGSYRPPARGFSVTPTTRNLGFD